MRWWLSIVLLARALDSDLKKNPTTTLPRLILFGVLFRFLELVSPVHVADAYEIRPVNDTFQEAMESVIVGAVLCL